MKQVKQNQGVNGMVKNGISHPKYQQKKGKSTNTYTSGAGSKHNAEDPEPIVEVTPKDHSFTITDFYNDDISGEKKSEQLCFHLHAYVKQVFGPDAKIPPVKWDPNEYRSHATWIDGAITIRTGMYNQTNEEYKAQASANDLVSIMLHEYRHFLNEDQGKYQAVQDDGSFINFETEIPKFTEEEIEVKAKALKEELLAEDSQVSEHLVEQIVEFEKSDWRSAWRYGPSNLSADEVSAYTLQKTLHENGTIKMSDMKYEKTLQRIEHYTTQMNRRLEYERTHNMGPDGKPLKP